MESIKTVFELLEKLGIQDEFIILAMIGAVVAYFLYKQNKLFQSYHALMQTMMSRIEQLLSNVKIGVDGFDSRCDACEQRLNSWHTDAEVWKETTNEKMDNLEDHMKEIKKQLLFK